MRNRMYGGVRGRKMKVGGKLLHFPPTRFSLDVVRLLRAATSFSLTRARVIKLRKNV